MHLFHSHKTSQSVDPLRDLSRQIDRNMEEACSRYEPEAFATQRVPADPYLEWAAQREAEREDKETVRWVYRHQHDRDAAVVVH